MNYIPISTLQDGHIYIIVARHARLGVWVAEQKYFLTARLKFNDCRRSPEWHWDYSDGETEYPLLGTAKPIREVGLLPNGLLEDEQNFVEYMNNLAASLAEELDNLPPWTRK